MSLLWEREEQDFVLAEWVLDMMDMGESPQLCVDTIAALQKEYATEFFSSLCSVDGALDEAAMEKISQSSSTQTSLSALLSGI